MFDNMVFMVDPAGSNAAVEATASFDALVRSLDAPEDRFDTNALLDSLVDDGRPLPRDWSGLVVGDALDVMIEDDTDAMAPAELLRDLDTIAILESKLAAAKLKRLASYDQRRIYRPAFRTAATALASRRRIGGRSAGADVNTAKALRELPVVFDALAAGQIAPDHVKRIVAMFREGHLREAVIEDQAWLTEQAMELAWSEFDHRVGNWAELVDPRDPADLDPAADKRRLVWANGVGGTALIETTTTALLLEQMISILQPTFDELHEQEWADARAAKVAAGENPDDVTTADLPRTDAMRWHDAHAIVLRRGAEGTGDPGTKLDVGIVVDLTTLMMAAQASSQRDFLRFDAVRPTGDSATGSMFDDTPELADPAEPIARDRCADAAGYRCETSRGVRMAPALAMWCALAVEFRRITLGADDRTASISHKGRLFNKAQRAAMLARDRHCRGPGCGRRLADLQADHIDPASRGGPTHTANGQILCGPCHRHKTWLQAMGLWNEVDHLWDPNNDRHPDSRARLRELPFGPDPSLN